VRIYYSLTPIDYLGIALTLLGFCLLISTIIFKKAKSSKRRSFKWENIFKNFGKKKHLIASILLAVFYLGFMYKLQVFKFETFHYVDFDLPLSSQGIWLISHGKEPFVTVRGLHLFGDHPSFIEVFLSLPYKFFPTPKTLFFFQCLAVSIGGIVFYFISNRVLRNNTYALIAQVSLYLSAPLHFANLFEYHSEVLSIPFLFFSLYFLLEEKYPLTLVFLLLALLCKENIVATMLLLALFIFKKNRKWGMITFLVGIAYLSLYCFYFPLIFNSPADFYIFRWLASFNFKKIVSNFFSLQNIEYFLKLTFQSGFLFLLDKSLLFFFSGSLWLTLISDWPYAHSINYHYVAPILPFLYVSSILAINNRKRKGIFVVWLLTFSIIGNLLFSPSETKLTSLSRPHFQTTHNAKLSAVQEIKSIVGNSSLSVSYILLPHFAEREIVYLFPNPFKASYWGFMNGSYVPPTPTKDVDYILLDLSTLSVQEEKCLLPLLLEYYTTVYQQEDVVLLKKIGDASMLQSYFMSFQCE